MKKEIEDEQGKIKNGTRNRWEVEDRDVRSRQSSDVHWLNTYCHVIIEHLVRDVSWARTT